MSETRGIISANIGKAGELNAAMDPNVSLDGITEDSVIHCAL